MAADHLHVLETYLEKRKGKKTLLTCSMKKGTLVTCETNRGTFRVPKDWKQYFSMTFR